MKWKHCGRKAKERKTIELTLSRSKSGLNALFFDMTIPCKCNQITQQHTSVNTSGYRTAYAIGVNPRRAMVRTVSCLSDKPGNGRSKTVLERNQDLSRNRMFTEAG